MHNYIKTNLRKVVQHIMSTFAVVDSRIDGMFGTLDDVEEKIDDIKSTLHDTNIISFTVTGTTSGTVTYIRQ